MESAHSTLSLQRGGISGKDAGIPGSSKRGLEPAKRAALQRGTRVLNSWASDQGGVMPTVGRARKAGERRHDSGSRS